MTVRPTAGKNFCPGTGAAEGGRGCALPPPPPPPNMILGGRGGGGINLNMSALWFK